MTQEEQLEKLANEVCQKPLSIAINECHDTWGQANPLCREHNQCRILEKSPEQIEYVVSPFQDNIFLRACPGSGKTEVVGLRVAHIIRNWTNYLGGLAVLTFTNNASAIIAQRVSQFTGLEKINYPHFIGTIDSWLHGYIAHPFGYKKMGYLGKDGDFSIRVIDNSSSAAFLNSFRTKYSINQTGNPSANHFYFELDPTYRKYIFSSGDQVTDTARNSVHLQEWQNRDLDTTKKAFWKNRFATYQDIETICFELLSEQPDLCKILSKRFPIIIIDECQDLSWVQLYILDKLKQEGTTLQLIGDLNQAIYDFKRVDPRIIDDYTKRAKFAIRPLSNNFRSCQTIVNVCKRIVNSDGVEKSKCTEILEKPCIAVIYPKDEIQTLPMWFDSLLVEKRLQGTRSSIVARNWNNVSRLRPSQHNDISGAQKTLAAAIYLWKSGYRQSIGDAIKYMGRFFADKYLQKYSTDLRHQYCPECINSHLRWRLFLSNTLYGCCTDTALSDLEKTWSQWVIIVRNQFGNIARSSWKLLTNNITDQEISIVDLDSNSFRAPQKLGEKKVLDTLPMFRNNKADLPDLRITTIHSVKGETLDAILLVSAPGKQGTSDGYWSQWLENPASEAARLAYVASSRPKHLLVWGIPGPIGNQERDSIINLGFSITELNKAHLPN